MLETSHIPNGFLVKDIRFKGSRHLVFSTNYKKGLLETIKTIYIDGTFKLVKKSFVQILSIRGFVVGDEGHSKQITLFTTIMSNRTSGSLIASF